MNGNFAEVALQKIKFKPTSKGKVTVKGKRNNRGGGYGLDILYKCTFEGDSFSITMLKNKLAKKEFQVEIEGSKFETNNIFCVS